MGQPRPAADEVVIRYRWGAKGGTAILFSFSGDPLPARVAKLALSGSSHERVESEVARLDPIRRSAEAAGARIPDGSIVRGAAGRPVLVARYLHGRSAAQLLRSGAIRPVQVLEQLGAWLERWNGFSLGAERIDAAWLEGRILGPAAEVAPLLAGAESYLAWLRRLAQPLAGSSLPSVAAHNDLTMVNVLLQPGLPPAVVDWEMAEPKGLPLADLCYAAVDAVALTRRRSDRAEAFVTCFIRDSAEGRLVRHLVERARERSGLPIELVPLCFHACWLRHAANEVRVTGEDRPRPFVRILRLLAERPSAFAPRANRLGGYPAA